MLWLVCGSELWYDCVWIVWVFCGVYIVFVKLFWIIVFVCYCYVFLFVVLFG